ncbi:MAG: hypothetical protein AVDCRST_MAG38-2759, partial [uncultured Solirubrobacteraceae bacterium]
GPLRRHRRAAGPHRGLRPRRTRPPVRLGLDATNHGRLAARRRSRGSRRGRHLGRGGPARPAGARTGAAAGGQLDDRVPVAGARGARRLPRRRAGLPGLSQLSPLGVRERGARSRAAPGGKAPARAARPPAAAADLRRVAAPRRAGLLRARRPPAGGLSRHPLQARRRAALERGADRAPGRERGGRRHRLQGRLQGDGGRRRDRRRALRARGRGHARRLPRGPGPRPRRRAWRPGPVRGPHHLGRSHPLGRGRARTRCRTARPELQAVALRLLARADALLRLLRRAQHRPLRRRPVRARPRPRSDPAARRADPSRRTQRRGAARARLGRLPGRPAGQPARSGARKRRIPPPGL